MSQNWKTFLRIVQQRAFTSLNFLSEKWQNSLKTLHAGSKYWSPSSSNNIKKSITWKIIITLSNKFRGRVILDFFNGSSVKWAVSAYIMMIGQFLQIHSDEQIHSTCHRKTQIEIGGGCTYIYGRWIPLTVLDCTLYLENESRCQGKGAEDWLNCSGVITNKQKTTTTTKASEKVKQNLDLNDLNQLRDPGRLPYQSRYSLTQRFRAALWMFDKRMHTIPGIQD